MHQSSYTIIKARVSTIFAQISDAYGICKTHTTPYTLRGMVWLKDLTKLYRMKGKRTCLMCFMHNGTSNTLPLKFHFSCCYVYGTHLTFYPLAGYDTSSYPPQTILSKFRNLSIHISLSHRNVTTINMLSLLPLIQLTQYGYQYQQPENWTPSGIFN